MTHRLAYQDYTENKTFMTRVPDPTRDSRLSPCENCGSEHNDIGRRRGPSLLMFSTTTYRVVCLACWHKGKSGRTQDTAIRNWNSGAEHTALQATRKAQGLSVERLADIAGVSSNTIWRAENGQSQPSKPTKRKIATALGVAVSEI